MHRVYLEGAWPGPGSVLAIGGDEARHALRTKRLRAGEHVEVFDGAGRVALCVVESMADTGERRERELVVRVSSATAVAQDQPRIEVWSATPKGARVDELVEGLSEVGAASWVPLLTARTVVEPRPAKLDRLRRLAVESAKQCGRAWILEIGRERTWSEAWAPGPGVRVVLADAGGGAYQPGGAAPQVVRLLIGPEGGWTEKERQQAQEAGAVVARFGPHAMRIETAAVAAAAIVHDRHRFVAGG